MTFSNRTFVYGPIGLLVLVAALYSLYWKVSADMLSARLDRANGGEIVPGVMFAFAAKSLSGFPFRLDVVLEGVTFAHSGPAGQTAWRAEKIALHALSYGKSRFVLEATGLQSFARPSENGGPPQVFYLTPAIARASAILQDGELTRFDLDLWEVEGKEATLGAPANRTFQAARAQLHFLGNPDKTISAALKIESAEIGEGFHAQIGPAIQLINATGKITEGQAFVPFRQGVQSPFAAADSWRESGGRIAVDSLQIVWNGVTVDVKGEIVPEGNSLQGAFRGGMTGVKAFALAAIRNQKPEARAQTMRVVDALAVKEPVPARVTLHDGALNVGLELLPGLVGGL